MNKGSFDARKHSCSYVDESELYNATLEYRAHGLGTFTATGSRFERDTTFNRDASLAAQAFFGLAFDGARAGRGERRTR